MHVWKSVGAFGLALCCAHGAVADVTFLSQSRSITASTTSNGGSQTLTAPDFAPFIQTIDLQTIFNTPTGPAVNRARTGIDCIIDPNGVRTTGSLTAAGGLNVNSNLSEAGAAQGIILVSFVILTPTPYTLFASPRPSNLPTDEFELSLNNRDNGDDIIALSQNDPAQLVNLTGILAPGEYRFRYKVEMTSIDAEQSSNFSMNLALPAPGTGAIIGLGGLVLTRRRR